MNMDTQEKLATSLTAETTELIPFLPYLLQDFWEIGSEPQVMISLLEEYADLPNDARVLDLACGKGAVSVRMAHQLGAHITGVDVIPDFVRYAEQKAKEFHVEHLCQFFVDDVNRYVDSQRDFDVVILGAVGDVLGDPATTLARLKSTIKAGGYIIIDECYLPDDGSNENLGYRNYDLLTKSDWDALFAQAGLHFVAEHVGGADNPDSLNATEAMAAITARAKELIARHPDKRTMFEGYIASQQAEYDDLDNNLVCAVWLLKKCDGGIRHG